MDSNTYYRITSITKTFTSLAAVIEVGWAGLEKPITAWVPELRGLKGKTAVDWEMVTMRQLGEHLAGLRRDCK